MSLKQKTSSQNSLMIKVCVWGGYAQPHNLIGLRDSFAKWLSIQPCLIVIQNRQIGAVYHCQHCCSKSVTLHGQNLGYEAWTNSSTRFKFVKGVFAFFAIVV